MKKLLMFFALITFSISAYTQTTTLQLDSSKLTFNKVYNDVKDGIMALSDGLKVGSEHVYKILVKQQVVNAVMYSIMLLLSIISLSVLYYRLKTIDHEKDGHNIPITCFIGLFSSILTLVSLSNLDIITTGFINPEYGAIEKILEIVK